MTDLFYPFLGGGDSKNAHGMQTVLQEVVAATR